MKCSIALFIVASMSAWFDNQMSVSLPPYPIPHQCHQCSSVNRRCHNRPRTRYTGIQRPFVKNVYRRSFALPPIPRFPGVQINWLPYDLNAWNRLYRPSQGVPPPAPPPGLVPSFIYPLQTSALRLNTWTVKANQVLLLGIKNVYILKVVA